MKITRVQISNYKSISSVDISPSTKMNVFIGENSVGKSNILNAVNWLLGPIYPSFNSTVENDHYRGELGNKIKIRLTFDDGKVLELAEEWVDSRAQAKSGLNLSGGYISDQQRQKYTSAYLGIDRQILDYLPSNRWTLIGRILLEINKQFQKEEIVNSETGEITKKSGLFKTELQRIRDDFLFAVKDDNGNQIMKEFVEILQKESAKQLNRPEEDFIVDLNLYDPWNFYRTLQLIVNERDTNLQFQASTLGMGIQASISIAILKAYASLKLRNNTPVFIEEPELFLHPQAQRNFYALLRELSDNGTQIFVTTHSPDFLSVGNFDEIFLVRKNTSRGTYISCAKPSVFVADLSIRHKIITTESDILLHYRNAYENTGDTQKANEAFFAKKLVLVEGQSESLALPYLFQLIGFNYVKECVTIVRCGDKNEIDRFYRLYSEFGIPCFIIFDGDKHLEGTQGERDNIKRNGAILGLFGVNADYPDGQVYDLFLGFVDEFEKELGFQTSQKGLQLYKQIKQRITDEANVPPWVNQVIEKIKKLPDVSTSILKSNEITLKSA